MGMHPILPSKHLTFVNPAKDTITNISLRQPILYNLSPTGWICRRTSFPYSRYLATETRARQAAASGDSSGSNVAREWRVQGSSRLEDASLQGPDVTDMLEMH